MDPRYHAGKRLGDEAAIPLVLTRPHHQGVGPGMSSCVTPAREATLSGAFRPFRGLQMGGRASLDGGRTLRMHSCLRSW